MIIDHPQLIQFDPTDEHPLDEDEIDLLFRIIDDNNSGKIDFMEFMVETSKPQFFYFAINFRGSCCGTRREQKRNYGQRYSGSMILIGLSFELFSRLFFFTHCLEMDKYARGR